MSGNTCKYVFDPAKARPVLEGEVSVKRARGGAKRRAERERERGFTQDVDVRWPCSSLRLLLTPPYMLLASLVAVATASLIAAAEEGGRGRGD